MTPTIRIRATEKSPHNVAYIYRRAGHTTFQCKLANGILCSYSYAGIYGDEAAFDFALDDCTTAEDALIACERFGSPRFVYEVFSA